VSLAPNVPWSTATSFPVILKDVSNANTPLRAQTIHFTGAGVINVANKVNDSTGKATGSGISPNTVVNGWTPLEEYIIVARGRICPNYIHITTGGRYLRIDRDSSIVTQVRS
jgi:hypothetical protein